MLGHKIVEAPSVSMRGHLQAGSVVPREYVPLGKPYKVEREIGRARVKGPKFWRF